MKTMKTKCLPHHSRAMQQLLRFVLFASLAMMALEQTMGQQRTPIPERDIQLPEFYGLYAVDKGKTVSVHGGTFSPMVEFLHFSKSPGAVELYQLQTQQPAPVRQPGRLQPPPDYDPGFLRGIPKGSIELELLKKPVSNKPEMVRVMATGRLAPGRYQITAQDLKNWFIFSVEGGPNDPGSPNPKVSGSACAANLRQLDEAKKKWAADGKRTNGDTAFAVHIIDYLKGGKLPECPAGGTYEFNPVGQKPKCSIHGSDF